ncbi:MAG: hypothetical protein RR877_01195 [Aurantimicrobium sp.]|uniref:hypothetical protein n=1 Tax=Aurantimicrobium sp. TaxID=1930784 RepID=UPI002FC6082A
MRSLSLKTFSFLVVTPKGLFGFQEQCEKAEVTAMVSVEPDSKFPNVKVEVNTNADLEEMRGFMRNIQDGEVMLQTLRQCPSYQNTFERDSSIT